MQQVKLDAMSCTTVRTYYMMTDWTAWHGIVPIVVVNLTGYVIMQNNYNEGIEISFILLLE